MLLQKENQPIVMWATLQLKCAVEHRSLKLFLKVHSYFYSPVFSQNTITSWDIHTKYKYLVVTNRSAFLYTIFPHIRPVGIIIWCSLQMRVLLENTTFFLHKVIRIASITSIASIIWGRVLYEKMRYLAHLPLLIWN